MDASETRQLAVCLLTGAATGVVQAWPWVAAPAAGVVGVVLLLVRWRRWRGA